MTVETIPLAPDDSEQKIEGMPKPLQPEGDLTIENTPGNPDATVALPGYVDVDGVEEGNKLEDQFQPTKGENHD